MRIAYRKTKPRDQLSVVSWRTCRDFLIPLWRNKCEILDQFSEYIGCNAVLLNYLGNRTLRELSATSLTTLHYIFLN